MIAVSRLLGCLLPLLMAAMLVAAPARAWDGHAADSATETGLSVLPFQAQPPVDHSSRWPRGRASLEEFLELDDDAEQHFQPLPALHPDLSGGVVLLPQAADRIDRADVPWRRPCAAYPTGPPQA